MGLAGVQCRVVARRDDDGKRGFVILQQILCIFWREPRTNRPEICDDSCPRGRGTWIKRSLSRETRPGFQWAEDAPGWIMSGFNITAAWCVSLIIVNLRRIKPLRMTWLELPHRPESIDVCMQKKHKRVAERNVRIREITANITVRRSMSPLGIRTLFFSSIHKMSEFFPGLRFD